MKLTMTSDLHCGACFQKMETTELLLSHLETCNYKKHLLPLAILCWFGGDPTHDIARFLTNFQKAAQKGLIRQYASAVANELSSMQRAKIHAALCKEFGFDYNKFRPFESDNITTLPSIDEAEDILLCSLVDYARFVKEILEAK
jgi:hypothetical protein